MTRINGQNLAQSAETNISEPKPKKSKFRLIAKLFLIFLIFAFTGLFIFSSQVLVSGQSSTSWIDKIPIIGHIRRLAESADRELKGEDRDRINILLLGMGGKKHEGSYLTDTIMLASLEPSSGKAAIVSIPRDLNVPIEDMGWQKINHVNAFAEAATPGSGGLAASQAVSDILAIPVDYYVRVDFEGFINIVNLLEGIKVYVDNTLDDYQYPVMGMEEAEPYEDRFEHLHVDTGWNTMDGEFALKYARSRHAAGIEGSDFARARRQQKILQAVKDKLLVTSNLLKPTMLANIINELDEHVSTNMKIWEMIRLWSMYKNITADKIVNRVIDSSPDGLLVETISETGSYILVPRSGDFSEIQYYITSVFSDAPPATKSRVATERATLEVRNGTWINGLASRAALDLEKYGFIVVRIGNSSRQNFQKSVIYDLAYGEKAASLAVLVNITGANVSSGLPQWLMDDIASELADEKNPVQPDFIIVLGQDADKTESGTENAVE